MTWREAPYTLAELTDEVLRLLTEQPATRLTGGGAHHDGTGISFTSTDAELLKAADPRRVLGARYPVTSSTETRHSPVTGLISGTSTPSAKRHRTTFLGP